MKVIARTNWLFPLLAILFVIAIILLAKQYSRTHLVLKKKVSFVKAKGGEFALKVSIFVQAKKFIERINLTDRLPPLVRLYEGGIESQPRQQDARKMEWNFDKLQEGETRIVSYIIYSKIGILGKFALPSAVAIYEKDGKIYEASSNAAFFVAEQRKKEIEEY